MKKALHIFGFWLFWLILNLIVFELMNLFGELTHWSFFVRSPDIIYERSVSFAFGATVIYWMYYDKIDIAKRFIELMKESGRIKESE